MDLRYLGTIEPKNYVGMDGRQRLDPTVGYALSEAGARRVNQTPEVCAWRVVVSFRGSEEQMVSHPLSEFDALDYESLLRRQMGDFGTTELRPVYGWPTTKETAGPLAGEKWLYHSGEKKSWQTVQKVALYGNRAIRAAEVGDTESFKTMMLTMHSLAEKVACSDHQEMVQALQEVGLPAIPCKNPQHTDLLHENMEN